MAGLFTALMALSPMPKQVEGVREPKMKKPSKTPRGAPWSGIWAKPVKDNRVARRARLREETIEVGMLNGQTRKQAKRALYELHHKNRRPS